MKALEPVEQQIRKQVLDQVRRQVFRQVSMQFAQDVVRRTGRWTWLSLPGQVWQQVTKEVRKRPWTHARSTGMFHD